LIFRKIISLQTWAKGCEVGCVILMQSLCCLQIFFKMIKKNCQTWSTNFNENVRKAENTNNTDSAADLLLKPPLCTGLLERFD